MTRLLSVVLCLFVEIEADFIWIGIRIMKPKINLLTIRDV